MSKARAYLLREQGAEAYKLGNVQSGDWQWAVGIKEGNGYICLALVNTVGTAAAGIDSGHLAELLAEACNHACQGASHDT